MDALPLQAIVDNLESTRVILIFVNAPNRAKEGHFMQQQLLQWRPQRSRSRQQNSPDSRAVDRLMQLSTRGTSQLRTLAWLSPGWGPHQVRRDAESCTMPAESVATSSLAILLKVFSYHRPCSRSPRLCHRSPNPHQERVLHRSTAAASDLPGGLWRSHLQTGVSSRHQPSVSHKHLHYSSTW